jgi:protein-tyrosine phosphatase
MWSPSWLTKPLEWLRLKHPTTSFDSQAESEMAKKEPISLAMNTRVLFVCMGNICRSPMAEGVFRQLVKQAGLDEVVTVASAGTHAFHQGEGADKRAIAAVANLALLQQQAPKRTHHKLQLLMRFATEHETATIPDPYYGNAQGFEQVLDYIEDACNGLLEVAKRRATQVAAA